MAPFILNKHMSTAMLSSTVAGVVTTANVVAGAITGAAATGAVAAVVAADAAAAVAGVVAAVAAATNGVMPAAVMERTIKSRVLRARKVDRAATAVEAAQGAA